MDGADAEWLEVLDADGRPTGERKLRAHVHRDGDWHRAFHLWIVTREGKLLVQRRAPEKDLAPGKLDVTVGGHLRAGELPIDAVREVEEELGVPASFADLVPLGTFRSERIYADAIDREYQEVYALVSDRPLREYRLAPREVDVLYEVPLERAVALWRDGQHVPAPGWDSQRRVNDALLIDTDLIQEGRDVMVAELEAVRAWFEQDVAPASAPAASEPGGDAGA